MRKTVKIGKLAFDHVTLEDAARRVDDLAAQRPMAIVVTPNADHVCQAERDGGYRQIVEDAALVTADGMPVVWASRLIRCPLPERVTGADLLPKVCEHAARSGRRVFIMGGMPGEAEIAARKLRNAHPGLMIVGTYCPPFGFEKSEEETAKAVNAVNKSGADILFLGVGAPKQERWLAANKKSLQCGVAIGVGASIAFTAGTIPRAPRWMQRSGVEWVYRLSKEPRRLAMRYAKDTKIAAIIARDVVRSMRSSY